MREPDAEPAPSYLFGHSDHELDRLRAQARFLEPTTRQFFLEAGIAPGMRVLDVGSGAGDVAFLARDLVGETGRVIGTDTAPAAIAAATAAARARAFTNVHFREGDPAELAFDEPFDAVVGRYVLLFQSDPAAMLRRLATRACDRWETHLAAGDVDALRAHYNPDYRSDDRRRLFRLSSDLSGAIATDRFCIEGGWRPHRTVLATAGDRLVLQHIVWTTGEAGANSEVVALALDEVDSDGRLVRTVSFDPDDMRAAWSEMWARWGAIDPTVVPVTTTLAEVIDSWNAKDPERLRAVFAEDLVVEDRRRAGIGRIDGRDAYVESVTALWALAPESLLEGGRYWLAMGPHGAVYATRRVGMVPDGGAFESDYFVLSMASGGCTTRLEFFEIDAADAALARFAELAR